MELWLELADEAPSSLGAMTGSNCFRDGSLRLPCITRVVILIRSNSVRRECGRFAADAEEAQHERETALGYMMCNGLDNGVQRFTDVSHEPMGVIRTRATDKVWGVSVVEHLSRPEYVRKCRGMARGK